MTKLSLSRAWDESRAVFARDGSLLIAVALGLVVLPSVVVGLVVPVNTAEAQAHHYVLQIAAALIGLIGQLAIIRLAIGPATTVGAAISHGARRFPAMLGAMLLLGLLLALLMIPLALLLAVTGSLTVDQAGAPSGAGSAILLLAVVAAVLVAVKFVLTAAVASAERVGPIQILKRSWSLTSGHYWKLLGFVVLLFIVAAVLMTAAGAVGGIIGALISPGLEPFSLGALVLALFAGLAQGVFNLFSSVMVARIYVQLAGRNEVEVSVPSSGT